MLSILLFGFLIHLTWLFLIKASPSGIRKISNNFGNFADDQTRVTDPLAQQKTDTANLQLQQYQNLIPYANQFLSRYMPQLGQTDFLSQMPQLSQDVYKSVQGDVEGTGGPFTSLKNNLLGNFDVGAQKFTLDPLKEQLIKQGLYSSGPGFDAQQMAGTNLANQRGLLGSQVDTQMLNFANQLGQQQFGNNQLLGFTEPMQAFGAASGLNAPQYQTPENFYDTSGSQAKQQLYQMLGQLGGMALTAGMGGAGAAGGMGMSGMLASNPGMSTGANRMLPNMNSSYKPIFY